MPQFSEEEGCKLFVYGVATQTPKEDLQAEFERFGNVSDAYNSGKGYAFITYGTKEEADQAKQMMNGTTVCGQEIKVDIARPRGAGNPRGGGRGRGEYRGRGRGGFDGEGRGRGGYGGERRGGYGGEGGYGGGRGGGFSGDRGGRGRGEYRGRGRGGMDGGASLSQIQIQILMQIQIQIQKQRQMDLGVACCLQIILPNQDHVKTMTTTMTMSRP